MGNLCSKSSNEPENFSTPGRTLGSAPAPAPKTAPVPSQFKTTAGRTLGGSSPTPDANDESPAARARRAAEERLAKSKETSGKGKLSQQLAEQKKKTQTDLLKQGSEAERRARDADEAADARNYN